MHSTLRLCATALLAVALVSSPRAQRPDVPATLAAQIDRIFKERAYDAPRFGPARWQPDGKAYAIVERQAGGGAEIARYDAATGATIGRSRKRASQSATIRGHPTAGSSWYSPTRSGCGGRTREATTASSTSRRAEPGDAEKLGGAAPEASLMFAKFSPDAHPRRLRARRTTSTSSSIADRRGATADERRTSLLKVRRGRRHGRYDRERHVGLGQRGGARHPRRLSLES